MAAPTTERTRTQPTSRRSAPPPSVSTARNRTRIVIGVALMVVAAFAAAVLYADAGEREAFLVMTTRVPAGELISASDLSETLAAIDGRSAVRASERAFVVGRVASVDLLPGSLLSPSHVSDRTDGSSDEAVIAARLDEGRAPSDLAIGDAVHLYEVPAEGDESSAAAAPIPGRVISIATAADGSALIVSVAVSPADARRAAVAAARNRITLVIAPS